MFHWYAINTYSGHEAKVKADLERRINTLGQTASFRRVVIPTEPTIETRDGRKVQVDKRSLPGYVLVHMNLHDESWTVVKGTPGVLAFVGPGAKPSPLGQAEVARLLHLEPAATEAVATYVLGEAVKVTAGPLADFDGEVVEVNEDAQRLRVLVSIFERQVPVELDFGQVKAA